MPVVREGDLMTAFDIVYWSTIIGMVFLGVLIIAKGMLGIL